MNENQITGVKHVHELRKMYGVCKATWNIWVAKVPGIQITKGQRMYTPAEVNAIVAHLGQP